MPEFIEREAAIAALQPKNAPALNRAFEAMIRSVPAADVRPVVLCRECKYTNRDGTDDPAIYCKQWDRWEMPPEAYCWLGKHKDGGQEE